MCGINDSLVVPSLLFCLHKYLDSYQAFKKHAQKINEKLHFKHLYLMKHVLFDFVCQQKITKINADN